MMMTTLQILRASQGSQAAKASQRAISTHMSCWQHCPSGIQGTGPVATIGTVPAGTSADVLPPAEGCPKCRVCGSCGLSLGVGGARSYSKENCNFNQGTCMPWC